MELIRLFAGPRQAAIACFVAVFAFAMNADAALKGINIEVTATISNPNFGAGVTAGDSFQGMIFYDDEDPNFTPNGTFLRSIIPGGDMLTIAGVPYDTQLGSATLPLTFGANLPLCLGDIMFNGCGGLEGIGLLFLTFNDDGTGLAVDGPPVFDVIEFTYSLSAKPTAVPEPGTLWLFGVGLIGLMYLRRRRAA